MGILQAFDYKTLIISRAAVSIFYFTISTISDSYNIEIKKWETYR